MDDRTAIYGHSRGYRALAFLAIAACIVSMLGFSRNSGFSSVETIGLIGFSILFLYAWRRSVRRVVVMRIAEEGFVIEDPAQPFGLLGFEEIEEIRIYALLERPMVAFRLHDPDRLRRRGPALLRMLVKAVWPLRHYQVLIQLDSWDDQVGAVKSVAVKAGIPIRSELI